MAAQPSGGSSKSSPNTFEDGLSDLYTTTARLALAPDASPHMQFIQLMQRGILQYRQLVQQQKAQAATQMQQQLAGQAAGMPGGAPGGPGGAPGGGPPGAGGGGDPSMGGAGDPTGGMGGAPGGAPNQIAPGGGPGMSGYGGVASPDDLQRILSGAGGQ
jgi:hypothetical protein